MRPLVCGAPGSCKWVEVPRRTEAIGEINARAVELLELVVRRLLEVVGGGAPLDAAADITALAAETAKTGRYESGPRDRVGEGRCTCAGPAHLAGAP